MKSELFDSEQQIVVLGPSIRTSPPGDAQDIPAFWQRFMAGGFLQRLPRRPEDGALYAVYCDYESDHTGAYTMVIGVAVEAGAAAEEGIRKVVIPPGLYARFAARGPAAEVLWSVWRHVADSWEARSRRRYAADYERHPLPSLAAMARGEVDGEVVVGLK